MTLEEILAAVAKLSAEEKGTIFLGLGKDIEKLPSDLEQKFLARKNQKLTDKDTEIETLKSQVTDLTGKLKPYQADESQKAKSKLKLDIGTFFDKVENNNKSMKGTFTREVINLKSKDENKDKDIATLATEYLKTHNGYTVKSQIVDIDDHKNTNTDVPSSVAEMIEQRKANQEK